MQDPKQRGVSFTKRKPPVEITDPDLLALYERAGRSATGRGMTITQAVYRRDIIQEQVNRNTATAAQATLDQLAKDRQELLQQQTLQGQQMQQQLMQQQMQLQQETATQQQILRDKEAAERAAIQGTSAAVSQSLKILSSVPAASKQGPTAQIAGKSSRAKRRSAGSASLRIGSTSQGAGSGVNISG